MYTTTPANWPRAVAERLREQHSPPRPPTVYCTDSPREWGSGDSRVGTPRLLPLWEMGGAIPSPSEAALKLGPLGVVGGAGAAARASAGEKGRYFYSLPDMPAKPD
jgi:hypothetical protein